MLNRYDIYDMGNGKTTESILPTPRLLDEGTVMVVEAYREEELDGDMARRYPGGLWRVRDDGYDKRYDNVEYHRVRVLVIEPKFI